MRGRMIEIRQRRLRSLAEAIRGCMEVTCIQSRNSTPLSACPCLYLQEQGRLAEATGTNQEEQPPRALVRQQPVGLCQLAGAPHKETTPIGFQYTMETLHNYIIRRTPCAARQPPSCNRAKRVGLPAVPNPASVPRAILTLTASPATNGLARAAVSAIHIKSP